MFQLREYQTEAINTIQNLPKGNPGLIVSPCGTGKGYLISHIAANAKGRTLIIVPSKELREDMIVKLNNIDSNLDVGSVQAELDDIQSKVIIATRQSLTHKKSTRIERMLEHGEFEYIICDEVHQAVDQIKNVLLKIDTTNSTVFGLTATPYNSEMFTIFKGIDYNKDILWMIENNYLVEPKVIQINTKTSLKGVKTIAGEFNQKDLELTVNTEYRNDLIVKAWKEFASDRKHTLIFCSGIDHSYDLANEFKSNGISSESIDSTLTSIDREKILNDFKSGKIKVLCNVGVLTTGFDFQPTDCIIYARPTKSKILFVQILGRGLRTAENKEDCLVLDFKDIASQHDIMAIDELFGVKFKNGEKFSDAKERIELEKQQYEEELKRKEEERQREIELIATQVKLFNREMNRAFMDVYYDWFKIENNTWAVSESANKHYAIHNYNNEFVVFEIISIKDNKNIEELNSFENVLDAIKFSEDNIKNPKSFAYKNADWKLDPITEKQKQYCRFGKTKFDAHKYFISNTVKWMIKDYIINGGLST